MVIRELKKQSFWKETLTNPPQTIIVPYGSQFVDAKMQRGQVCVWFLADVQTTSKESVEFRVLGTGEEFKYEYKHSQIPWEYLATVQNDVQTFVWHVIYKRTTLGYK